MADMGDREGLGLVQGKWEAPGRATQSSALGGRHYGRNQTGAKNPSAGLRLVLAKEAVKGMDIRVPAERTIALKWADEAYSWPKMVGSNSRGK